MASRCDESNASQLDPSGHIYQATPATFFTERSDASLVKTRLVTKYFIAWARVITARRHRNRPIAYIDLFAGPGRYRDGNSSTPLKILSHAIRDPTLRSRLVTFFNDSDADIVRTLRSEIRNLPGIKRLAHYPKVNCSEVDDKLATFFDGIDHVPRFSFLDPFGYKGISIKLIQQLIKNWGSDCVFFFNYKRINPAINNPSFQPHMKAFFGVDELQSFRSALESLDPNQRRAKILECLANGIRTFGDRHVLPFTFHSPNAERPSHMLILVTKHFKGYEIMKELMATESTRHEQGVPSLTYSLSDATNPLLFSLNTPLNKLSCDLVSKYRDQSMRFDEIYRDHSIDTPFIRTNYRQALMQLEQEGKIQVQSDRTRRSGTFGANVSITFSEACGHGYKLFN